MNTQVAPTPQTPQTYPDAHFWWPTAYLQHLKIQGSDSSSSPVSATANGDLIGCIDEAVFGFRGIPGTGVSDSLSNSNAMRAVLYSDATQNSALRFGTSAHTGFVFPNTKGDFRFLHGRMPWTIGFKVRFESLAAAGTILCTTTGSITAPTGVGVILGIQTTGRLRFQIYDSASRAIFALATAPVLSAGTWYTVILTSDGTTCTLYTTPAGGSTTTTTGAVAISTITNAVNTNSASWLSIGNNIDDSQYFNGELADLFITRSVLPASYRTAFLSYNPARISTIPAVTIRSRDTILTPADISPCWGWWDASDKNSMYKFDQTTPITVTGDDVGKWLNRVGGRYLTRDFYRYGTNGGTAGGSATSAHCPVWKVAQINGLPALYFNGTDANEQSLSIFTTTLTRGDWCMFYVLQMDSDVTGIGPGGTAGTGPGSVKRGCHIMTQSIGNPYLGIVGPGDGDPNRVFQHVTGGVQNPSSTIATTTAGVPLIVEEWRQGTTWNIALNGVQRAVLNGTGDAKYTQTLTPDGSGFYPLFNPFNIGNPAGHTEATDNWNLKGPVGEIAIFPFCPPQEIRRRLRAGFADKWGASATINA